MFLLQQKRRQKPNHSILRRIKKYAFSQRRIHNRPRRNLQIDPLNKPPPANFLSGRTFFSNLSQFLLQVSPNLIHVIQQLLFLYDSQKLQSNPASQWTTPKSSPMLPGRDRVSKFFLGDKRSQRQPRRNRLRNRHNIRSHAKTLKREHSPGPPQPTLNLIKDQSRPVPVRRRPASLKKLHRTLIDSALAKNRLQHNRASIVIHRRPQSLNVVLRNKRDVFQHRL